MKSILILNLCLFFSATYLCAQEIYFPPLTGDSWETMDPVDLNWCEENIDALYGFLEEEESRSFMLLKDGKIVLEKYFGSFTQDSIWVWFSAGKSLTSVLIGIAQSEGLLTIQDKTSDYLGTGWTSLPPEQEDSITIWHQLTMTSGLDESDFACTDPSCLIYKTEPGSRWFYHNGPYSLLRNVAESATGLDYNLYTRQVLTNRIGMVGRWVKAGFNNFYFSRARDMARFGLLVQNGGFWKDELIVSDTAYFNQMTIPSQNLNPSYGYLWWLNGQASHIRPGGPESFPGPIAPDAPSDVFTAAGAQGQFISICPSKGLLMVRQGRQGDTTLAGLSFFNEIWKRIENLECTSTSTRKGAFPMNAFRVYPNPVNQAFTIQVDPTISESLTYTVYDALGHTLQTSLLRGDGSIDVSVLSKGVYFLKLETASRAWSTRLIKK